MTKEEKAEDQRTRTMTFVSADTAARVIRDCLELAGNSKAARQAIEFLARALAEEFTPEVWRNVAGFLEKCGVK